MKYYYYDLLKNLQKDRFEKHEDIPITKICSFEWNYWELLEIRLILIKNNIVK